MIAVKIRKGFAAVTLLSLALISCEMESGDVGEATQGNNRPADESEREETEREAPAVEPEQSSELSFGETFTYENGLSITVSAPEPYTKSDTGAGAEDSAAQVKFDVTVVNGTSERYEPALFSTTLQSDNAEGDAIFDSANGINGAPSTVLLPGREASFAIAYGVSNPADLVLEVSPGFEYESIVYFTG
ncbi:MAG: hypothetical protein M3P53_13560 [Actinomycetota bacterium]|nr:hypothetical protein [Actinomycetota bacterium]